MSSDQYLAVRSEGHGEDVAVRVRIKAVESGLRANRGGETEAGDKVRISAQLRDATRDTEVWADTFERDVADVFTMESEIAQKIARQMRTTISPAENAEFERQPTRDVSAFTLYNRGRAGGGSPQRQRP